MTNKLTKFQEYPWWENAHAELKEARTGNNELAEQLEKRIRAGYLRQIRRQLEEKGSVRDVVAAADPTVGAKSVVMKALGHMARFGSDDLFEESVDQVLRELEVQRKAAPALYLVNDDTGELIMPITEDDIFVPPDYVDEGGITRSARPMIHPGIAAGLGMKAAKAHRHKKVADMIKEPVQAKAFEHLLEPDKIVEMARKRLEHAGITFVELSGAEEREIEFGRESSEGAIQSINPAFHRSSMFASILAQKVLNICAGGKEVELGKARLMEDKKSRWFVIEVRFRSATARG